MSGGDTTRITARPGDAIDLLLDRCGRRIVCATPLGLGKPVALLNALYQRAIREPDIQLTFVTALSLAVPRAGSELERRFLEPFAKRVFDGVPELDYLAALERQALPSNIVVREFYFRPGSTLRNPTAQQQYISSNYTHVARDVVAMGCNVILVMVSERDGRYSLSCNPDLVLDVARMLRAAGRDVIVAALVNRRLPFMPHDAEVGPEYFDIIVDAAEYETRLFSVRSACRTRRRVARIFRRAVAACGSGHLDRGDSRGLPRQPPAARTGFARRILSRSRSLLRGVA